VQNTRSGVGRAWAWWSIQGSSGRAERFVRLYSPEGSECAWGKPDGAKRRLLKPLGDVVLGVEVVDGQIDFTYGASLSEGGKAIIAMPSATNKGVSKIAPVLTEGAGVVTTRNHIHWLVTEYGAVDLYGKSLQERAKLIISVAHPDARESLDRAAFERFGPHFHAINI